MFTISNRELIGIYLFLKKRDEMDETMLRLFNRMEAHLYSILSIEEMEKLDILYPNNIDA